MKSNFRFTKKKLNSNFIESNLNSDRQKAISFALKIEQIHSENINEVEGATEATK